MPVKVFGVTAAMVRAHHFAQLAPFSTTSNPTAATVAEMVTAEAAVLGAKLLSSGIDGGTISDDAGIRYPLSYAWCQETVRLGAAVRVLQVMAGTNPEVAKAWASMLRERYKELHDDGFEALGDAPSPEHTTQGPRTHLDEHNLDTGEETDISDAIPTFRKSDQL